MELKPEYKTWAKRLRASIPGGTVSVARHYDEAETTALDIFTSDTAPGMVAATIGVMEVDLSRNSESQLFTEILMDSRSRNTHIANIVANIGFYVVKDGWPPFPGTVFENMIEMYSPDLKVKHIMFVPPFQWESRMAKVDLGPKTIHPILAVPITDGENQFVKENGSDALEDLWEQTNCDVLDWSREGVAQQ